jgi:hypothetical protein
VTVDRVSNPSIVGGIVVESDRNLWKELRNRGSTLRLPSFLKIVIRRGRKLHLFSFFLQFQFPGIVHVPVGKVSFGADKLIDNARAVLAAILRAKPASAKGNYVQGVTLSTTMGPGIKLDVNLVRALAA